MQVQSPTNGSSKKRGFTEAEDEKKAEEDYEGGVYCENCQAFRIVDDQSGFVSCVACGHVIEARVLDADVRPPPLKPHPASWRMTHADYKRRLAGFSSLTHLELDVSSSTKIEDLPALNTNKIARAHYQYIGSLDKKKAVIQHGKTLIGQVRVYSLHLHELTRVDAAARWEQLVRDHHWQFSENAIFAVLVYASMQGAPGALLTAECFVPLPDNERWSQEERQEQQDHAVRRKIIRDIDRKVDRISSLYPQGPQTDRRAMVMRIIRALCTKSDYPPAVSDLAIRYLSKIIHIRDYESRVVKKRVLDDGADPMRTDYFNMACALVYLAFHDLREQKVPLGVGKTCTEKELVAIFRLPPNVANVSRAVTVFRQDLLSHKCEVSCTSSSSSGSSSSVMN